ALLRPGVGMSPLTAHREAATMANAAVAADVHQPLDVHRDFGAQRALGLDETLDHLTEAADLGVAQVTDPRRRRNAGLLEQPLAGRPTDAVDVGEPDLDALLARKVHSSNTRHISPAAACAWECACR